MAEKLRGTGYVEARDLTEYKIGLLEENIARSGLSTGVDPRQECKTALFCILSLLCRQTIY